MFTDHELFQVFCRFCFIKAEAKTKEEAIKLVEEHEKECPKNKKL